MPTRTHRGFTLIEMMVAVAILGILTAMGFAAYQEIGRQAAPQNATHDLYSQLSKARAIAQERNINVWVIIYPERNAAGTRGRGAYFVFEDRAGTFDGAAEEVRYANFHPPANYRPDPTETANRLREALYLDSYNQNALFAVGSAELRAPFDTLLGDLEDPCTFCSGEGEDRRGAIVFRPEGGVRFIDGDGNEAPGRAHALALRDEENHRSFVFGISRATGFIGFEAH